jgi:hypothetical protein
MNPRVYGMRCVHVFSTAWSLAPGLLTYGAFRAKEEEVMNNASKLKNALGLKVKTRIKAGPGGCHACGQ